MFITVYKTTRHYGGPEEGGWWYNWYEVLETVNVPRRWAKKANKHTYQIETLKSQMLRKYAHEVFGNIYNVNGGAEVSAYIEYVNNLREFESKEAPHYY